MNCLLCASPERVQDHHVARRVNLSVTVPLCSPCHRRVTARQRDAGIFRQGAPADERKAWAILGGFMILLTEHARMLDASELAEHGARQQRATLRLLAGLGDDPASSLGPNPVASTVGRRRRQIAAEPTVSPAQTLEGLARLLDALAEALHEWLPGTGPAQLADRLAKIAGLIADDHTIAEPQTSAGEPSATAEEDYPLADPDEDGYH